MEEPKYITYEEAKKIVSDIIEMEHPRDDGRRVFSVLNQRGEEICWFDANDVEGEIDATEFDEVKDHILHFIPEWAV